MKKLLSLFLLFLLLFQGSVHAAESHQAEEYLQETVNFLLNAVPDPTISDTGGEWTVIGLARSGIAVPEKYFDTYYQNVETVLKETDGILTQTKYTEYSRLILALTAIGKDVTNVAGYNLLEYLTDLNQVLKQGINGPIFALIALDSHQYEIPPSQAEVPVTREALLQEIIKEEITDESGTVGGFSLAGNYPDPDITGMALQALAPYRDRPEINAVIERAVMRLSALLKQDNITFESYAQALTGLSALGIDAAADSRFTLDGKTLLDRFYQYQTGKGGYCHLLSQETNLMATEQAAYALTAYLRLTRNQSSLYDMTDLSIPSASQPEPSAPPEEEKTDPPVIPYYFSDTEQHWAKESIGRLAASGIVSGTSPDKFEPDRTMTRAEFCALLVKALNLTGESEIVFADVKETDWYAVYVSAAVHNGLIKGVSETEFQPEFPISREETAVLIQRAALLCKMDTTLYEGEEIDILCQFTDYIHAADWSRTSLALCVKNGFFSSSAIEIRPKDSVTRAEVVTILERFLTKAAFI